MIIFLLLIGCKCGNDEKYQIMHLIGKEIVLDESYQSISISKKDSTHQSAFSELKKPIKIVTYMDSSSCTGCAMQILIQWNRLLREIQSDSVGFVTVVYPSDTNRLKMALRNLNLWNPLLYDTNNKFLINNKLLNVFARNRTFLLDKNNNIIVVGEPLRKSKLWNLYKSNIQTLVGNGGVIL